MVYCTAEFKAKEGKEDELFQILKALEIPTHKENGCIEYKVMRKINNPFAQGKHYGILFNEIWESVEVFERHCQMPYIVDFFEKECLSEIGLVENYNVNLFQ
ncbi:antibiotic biosynthesis monooxygenase [bacterium]|nr:antibiotic biosynthesis monooxygenase [bacterium]MBU1993918.1 antibiotic biosynthesis monooxygenase [bacterium]